LIFTAVLVAAGCSGAVQLNNDDGAEPKTTEEQDVSGVANDEEDGEVPFTEYSLLGTQCFWVNQFVHVPDDNRVAVINSKQEFEKFIACRDGGSYPEIDFAKHSLLLTKSVSMNPISDISIVLLKQSTDYILNVEITTLKKANWRQRWIIALVTDKLSEKSDVNLNVTIFEDDSEPDLFELEMGTYEEPNPATPEPMGRTRINFIDKETLVLTRGIDSAIGSENETKFKYEICGYTISLIPADFDEGQTVHYFRILNHRKFEIGYLYPMNTAGSTIPPTMIFVKE